VPQKKLLSSTTVDAAAAQQRQQPITDTIQVDVRVITMLAGNEVAEADGGERHEAVVQRVKVRPGTSPRTRHVRVTVPPVRVTVVFITSKYIYSIKCDDDDIASQSRTSSPVLGTASRHSRR